MLGLNSSNTSWFVGLIALKTTAKKKVTSKQASKQRVSLRSVYQTDCILETMAPAHGDRSSKVFGQSMRKQQPSSSSSRYQRQFGGGSGANRSNGNNNNNYNKNNRVLSTAQLDAESLAARRRQKQALGTALDQQFGLETFAATNARAAQPLREVSNTSQERRGWLYNVMATTVRAKV